MGKRKTGNAHNLIESLYISKKVGGEKKLQKKKGRRKITLADLSYQTMLRFQRYWVCIVDRKSEKERKKIDH